MAEPTRIRLGVLDRAYGLKGGLRCKLDGVAIPELSVPCDVHVGYSESFSRPMQLDRYETHRNELLCFFKGVSTMEEAEEYRDQALYISPDSLTYREPYSNPGLAGYEVLDEQDRLLGTITSVIKTPAHYIWAVDFNGEEWMVPAIDEFVVEVRHDSRTAIVRLIPGFLPDEPSGNEEENDHGE